MTRKLAYGSAEKATPVRKDLMALATLPRVIGPGEEFSLPVTVFTMDDNIKNVQLTVEGNDMISLASAKTKNVRFVGAGEQMTNFTLKARNALGKGSVKVTARSGSNVAVYDVDIDVRTPNPRITNVFSSRCGIGSKVGRKITRLSAWQERIMAIWRFPQFPH